MGSFKLSSEVPLFTTEISYVVLLSRRELAIVALDDSYNDTKNSQGAGENLDDQDLYKE